ncbi:AAA family ATPase [Rhodoferax sp. BLA1]|uniref:AAA family ATPase n=1 Tax=Rhodoferax sp. BLA1 TaxID=2576062 RepID=UPI0015D14144|nr:AAA family ATPase [Rhodoferax sp. BLA1]
MTTTAWPGHYTPADATLIERMRAWMDERKYSQASLARLARISSSSLNQILKGSYATSPSKLLANVESAMRNFDEGGRDTSVAVETSVYKMAFAACSMARRYRNFAVFSGFVGTGKTFALKRYARKNPNTFLIEATPTMTPQSLVRLLSRTVVGVDAKGSIDDKFRAVVDALRNTDSLLIVDEAETLTPHQLHTLRRLRDLANIGIVLAGTEYLAGLIKPERGQFDQIRSRCGFWPETVRGITEDDAAALVQANLGTEEVPDAVVQRLYAHSRGSARMLVEGLLAGLKEFRRGRPLSVALVDSVAKDALCLQSAA